jgi:bacillithiol biosynthesis deacetylase BshB1
VKALFLSPHPDDAELFCGGTIASLVDRAEVVLADMTRGEMSSNGTVELRAAESAAAAEALGVALPREQLGLPDAALDVREARHVEAVTELLHRLEPDLLFAPWPDDRHPDHVATGEIARRAVALVAGPPRLLFYPCHGEIEPTLLVDVSAVIDRWEAAVRCYASQFLGADGVPTPINRPGFVDHHRNRRIRWGSRRGVEFAEGLIHEGPWPVSPDELGGR